MSPPLLLSMVTCLLLYSSAWSRVSAPLSLCNLLCQWYRGGFMTCHSCVTCYALSLCNLLCQCHSTMGRPLERPLCHTPPVRPLYAHASRSRSTNRPWGAMWDHVESCGTMWGRVGPCVSLAGPYPHPLQAMTGMADMDSNNDQVICFKEFVRPPPPPAGQAAPGWLGYRCPGGGAPLMTCTDARVVEPPG